jgi:hypothetical protein
MQVSNNIYLFVVSCEIKYATYIDNRNITASTAEGRSTTIRMPEIDRD